MIDWPGRLRVAGVHLGISLGIAVLSALLVFLLWYPYPYREVSGGRELFLLVVAVDVVLGPLITLAIFDRRKPRRELVLDLSVVGAVQLAALAYGLWTVMLARPVYLSFEFDRFRVVHRAELAAELLERAPAALRDVPLGGPALVAVRPFRSRAEESEATLVALGGVSLSARPDLWEPYDAAQARVRAAARPLAELKERFPDQTDRIDAAIARASLEPAQALWLPLVSRRVAWTVILDGRTLRPAAFVDLDTF